jgi:uncharacterized membrane-anchored protein YjiN (DUF445 family)
MFNDLITQLIVEGKNDKAKAALSLIEEKLPEWITPSEALSIQMAQHHLTLGEDDKAKEIIKSNIERSLQYMSWYQTLNNSQLRSVSDYDLHQYIIQSGFTMLYENGMQADAEEIVAMAREKNLL